MFRRPLRPFVRVLSRAAEDDWDLLGVLCLFRLEGSPVEEVPEGTCHAWRLMRLSDYL